jgi:methylmalonyl-CoA/ethylmalonyl-CoA epimerase
VTIEFDHIAHAAPRLRDLLAVYRDVLGGVPFRGGVNAATGYRALQLTMPGGERIELLESLDGSSFLNTFLERHPRGGLHHLTYRVADLDAMVGRLLENGIEPFGVGPRGESGRQAFVHPYAAHGVLIQFVDESQVVATPWSDAELDAFLARAR